MRQLIWLPCIIVWQKWHSCKLCNVLNTSSYVYFSWLLNRTVVNMCTCYRTSHLKKDKPHDSYDCNGQICYVNTGVSPKRGPSPRRTEWLTVSSQVACTRTHSFSDSKSCCAPFTHLSWYSIASAISWQCP